MGNHKKKQENPRVGIFMRDQLVDVPEESLSPFLKSKGLNKGHVIAVKKNFNGGGKLYLVEFRSFTNKNPDGPKYPLKWVLESSLLKLNTPKNEDTINV